ncbi:MAG: SAM-dependent methyltransferase, partial [Pauljensenia sp.]
EVPPAPVHVFDEELGGQTPRGVDVARALGSLHLPAPLAQLRLRRAPDVTEERHYVPGEPQPHVIIEHQGAGLGRAIAVGSALAALVGAADGELTVSQIITAVAVLTDQDAAELLEQVEEPALGLIRCGMLEVVGGA